MDVTELRVVFQPPQVCSKAPEPEPKEKDGPWAARESYPIRRNLSPICGGASPTNRHRSQLLKWEALRQR